MGGMGDLGGQWEIWKEWDIWMGAGVADMDEGEGYDAFFKIGGRHKVGLEMGVGVLHPRVTMFTL